MDGASIPPNDPAAQSAQLLAELEGVARDIQREVATLDAASNGDPDNQITEVDEQIQRLQRQAAKLDELTRALDDLLPAVLGALREADDRPFEERPGGLTGVSTGTEGAASGQEAVTETLRVASADSAEPDLTEALGVTGAPSAHEDLTEVVGPTATASAQEDLKTIMAGVKAINEQKERSREELTRAQKESARTASASASPFAERSPWMERTLLLAVGLVLGGVTVLALAQGRPPSPDQAAALTGSATPTQTSHSTASPNAAATPTDTATATAQATTGPATPDPKVAADLAATKADLAKSEATLAKIKASLAKREKQMAVIGKAAAGLKIGGATQAAFDAAMKDLNAAAASLSGLSKEDSLRLQEAMDKMAQFDKTLSNLLEKISDTAQSISQNIK